MGKKTIQKFENCKILVLLGLFTNRTRQPALSVPRRVDFSNTYSGLFVSSKHYNTLVHTVLELIYCFASPVNVLLMYCFASPINVLQQNLKKKSFSMLIMDA